MKAKQRFCRPVFRSEHEQGFILLAPTRKQKIEHAIYTNLVSTTKERYVGYIVCLLLRLRRFIPTLCVLFNCFAIYFGHIVRFFAIAIAASNFLSNLFAMISCFLGRGAVDGLIVRQFRDGGRRLLLKQLCLTNSMW